MSEEDFHAFHPGSEEAQEDWEAEAKYRSWCEDMDCDPLDPDSRDDYKEEGGDSWDDMDENDQIGWTDNMNKD